MEINRRAEGVVRYLRERKDKGWIDEVHYCDNGRGGKQDGGKGVAERYMTPTGGYGGLVSFTVNAEKFETSRFYDELRLCKGPSLGTNFTICMPYAMLAHYHELEEVGRYGVRGDLLRISVGLEEEGGETCEDVLKEAFERSRL